MITRPFFGLMTPKLEYTVMEDLERSAIQEISLPKRVALFLKEPGVKGDDLAIRSGDDVKTGQRLGYREDGQPYIISSVTGTISEISGHTGYLGQTYLSVSIDVKEEDQWDDEFKKVEKPRTSEIALHFLNYLPGNPDFASLLKVEPAVSTIVVNGLDRDLLITTNQIIVKTEIEALTRGIEVLKSMTRARRIILVVPPNLEAHAKRAGAEVKAVEPLYPNSFPQIIMKKVLGIVVAAGQTAESMGVGFMNAEAVVALSKAFNDGEIPVHKMLTVIDKNNSYVNAKVRIGTPINDVLNSLHIETKEGDRVVLGGPMTGHAAYSGDIPVLHDTDAIMVQDRDHIVLSQKTPCVNCGECVRACPANIPVNMLIRYLENGLYEEAVHENDLLSCIECGLCSYVCISRIPIFHYVMFGKYEYHRANRLEEFNA